MASAQFVVEGVIHDSRTLVPISDVVVFVLDDETGEPISPGLLGEPEQQGQITGPDGRYRIEVIDRRMIRLGLERPDARFVYPSDLRPPDRAGSEQETGRFGLSACREIPCPGGAIGPSDVPVEEGQPYALRFDTVSGQSARNNHVPVDALGELIQLELAPDRQRAYQGELVTYRVRIESQGSDPLEDAQLRVTLPSTLRFLPSSAAVARRIDDGPPLVEEVEARQADLQLSFDTPLEYDRPLELRFAVRVAGPIQSASQVRTQVSLIRPGGIVLKEASASLQLGRDPLLGTSVILGRVFCDQPDAGPAGWQDEGEAGLYAARIYLDTGFWVETDRDGLFSFTGVPPGTRLLKLDEGSLPPGSSPRSPIRRQLYLSPGTPGKVRFAVDCRFETWRGPTKVEVKKRPGPKKVGPPPPAVRTLDVSIDAESETVGLGGRIDRFTRAELQAGRFDGGLRFFPRVVGPYTPTRWTIAVEEVDEEGSSVRALRDETLTGRGYPPLFVDLPADPPREGHAYRARLRVRAGELDGAVSAPVDVTPPRPSPSPAGEPTLIGRAEEATLEEDLARLAPVLKELEPSTEVVIEAHVDPGEDEEARARALGERAKALLDVPADRVRVVSKGASEPLFPNLLLRMRQKNRRVEVYVRPVARPAPSGPPAQEAPPRRVEIEVDQQRASIPLVEEPRIDLSMDLDVPAKIAMTLHDGRGGESRIRRVATHDWVTRPGQRQSIAPVWNPKDRTLEVGSERIGLPAPLGIGPVGREEGGAVVTLSNGSEVQRWSVQVAAQGRTLARRSGLGAPPAEVALSYSATVAATIEVAAEYPGKIRFEPPPVPATAGSAFQAPAMESVRLFGLRPQERIDASGAVLAIGAWRVPLPELEGLKRAEPPSRRPKVLEETGTPEAVKAAEVEMRVPNGELLRPSLPVVGRTRPENEIRINGDPVPVAPDGRFAYTLPLEPGDNRVQVESRDEEGNVALFDRRVATSSAAWFLMAVGEGEVSTGGARLAGSNGHTRVEAGPLSMDGRLLVYGRGRFVLPGPFERFEVVGRVDTAEQGDSTVLRLSDDPLRLLPALGDESLEVQDGVSRHKVYLDVTADRSRLRLGNSATRLAPFGESSFFNFRRAGFGLHGDLVKSFSSWDETRVTGAYTFENEGLRRGHDELQGTGGSMYWLSNDELVEGSARVRLVVRDRDTGLVLTSVNQTPGEDYELRPREGRITFTRPVPHVSGYASLGMNRSVALTGHPIFVVVDYEYLAEDADDASFGVEVRETLFSQLELYFGTAGEERIGEDHRMLSGALAWRPAARSYLELEYARSSGSTGLGALSVDGGLSYVGLDPTLDPQAEARLSELDAPFFGALDENAMSLEGRLDFADLSDDVRGHVQLYGRKAGLRFSSLSAAREQGRLAGGLSAAYGITGAVTARARVDAAFGLQPDAIAVAAPGTDVPGVFRTLGGAGIDYRAGKNAASVDVAHLRTALAPDRGAVSSTGVAVSYERRLTDALGLSLTQDALFGADALTGGGLGRFSTTLAGYWRLSETLQLSLAETVRWSGDNATQLGLRVQDGEGLSTYVAERFSQAGSAPRLTTIIGAEDTVAEGSRTYGELQMDGVLHPARTRAVLGMDNRWRVADGVHLLLAYERAQLTSGTPAPSLEEASPFAAPFGGGSATLGGFGEAIRFLPGAVSRDALAVGVTWTGLRRLKLSQRVELRVDHGGPAGFDDYLVLGTRTGLTTQLLRDVSVVGRLTFQNVRNMRTDAISARALEGSVAAVYRPRFEDWLTLVVRYTKLLTRRPEALDPTRKTVERDAFSVEPIIDTPWNLQLVERVAMVNNRIFEEGLPGLGGWMLLWVNRLNARFLEVLEAGAEYRMLLDLDLRTADRGFLVEAGYLPVEYVRIGAGYNFTRFSDDVLVLADRDASGPFLRVTARY